MADGTVRWGMIGCGNVTDTKNGPGLYSAAHSELVGIQNRTRAKAEDWVRRHGHGKVYATVEELLAVPEIDIVYVATTPDCHKEQALAVAAAGKHCYLEKPIALSYEDAQEIRDAFEAAGKKCFVAHYRRGMARYREVKRLLDAGEIGRVRGIQIIRTQRQTAEELLPREQKPWRVLPEVSGGSHFYEGDIHMLDLCDYLVGPATDASLQAVNLTGCYESEDGVSLAMTMGDGVLFSGIWCYAAYAAIDRFLIFGDAGSIEFPYYDNAAPLRVETMADPTEAAHEGVMGGVRQGPQLVVREVPTAVEEFPGTPQVQDIVDELRGEGQCASTLESAMRSLRIACLAREKMNART